MILAIIYFFLSLPSFAQEPAKSATTVHYELQNLRAIGFSQYNINDQNTMRQYLHFKNEQGHHYIIYEEVGSNPPLKEIANLRQAGSGGDTSCFMTIDCASKAFCTGDCHNMYYEISNRTPTNPPGDQNRCQVRGFTCERIFEGPINSLSSAAPSIPVTTPVIPASSTSATSVTSPPSASASAGPAPASVGTPPATPNPITSGGANLPSNPPNIPE